MKIYIVILTIWLTIFVLFTACSSIYHVSRDAFPGVGADAAYFMRQVEYKDTCWVQDSTWTEWEVRCK